MKDVLTHAATRVGEILRKNNLTIGTAESCTGGLLASVLTDIPGSSEYMNGGIVAYNNLIKTNLLYVNENVIEKHGAVSFEVAKDMAYGAIAALNVNIGIGITGIAGPDGGTATKPVGLVYVAVAWKHGKASLFEVNDYYWEGDRQENKEYSVLAALQMVIDIFE
jgi:nicotinamide-nucleotide amidase